MLAAGRHGIVALGTALVALAQDAASLRIEREVAVRGAPVVVTSLDWSADGRWIACGGPHGEVFVVAADTGALVHEWAIGFLPVGRLRFAPDSTALAAVGDEVAVWDLATGAERGRFPAACRTALAWSADGARLAFAAAERQVRLLAAQDLTTVVDLALGDAATVTAVAVAPRGNRVAVATDHGTVHTFDLAHPDAPTDERVPAPVVAIDWLADDRQLRLTEHGALLGGASACGTVLRPQGLAVGPDGRLVMAWNPAVLVGYDAGARFTRYGGGPAAIAGDGERWVRAGYGSLEVHRGREVVRRLPLPAVQRRDLRQAAFSGDGRYAVVEHDDGLACIDLTTTRALPLPAGFRGRAMPHAGGPEILLWQVRPWDRRAGSHRLSWWVVQPGEAEPLRRIRELSLPGEEGVRLDRSGRYAAVGGRVFDLLADGALLWSTDAAGAGVVPAADGTTAVRAVTIKQELLGLLVGDPRGGRLELVDKDDHVLASAGLDHAVRWLDFSPDAGQVGVLTGQTFRVFDAGRLQPAFEADGGWSCARWVAVGRVLLIQEEPAPRLELRDCRGPLAGLALPGPVRSLAVDAAGARAVAVLADRILVLRIHP